MGQEKMEGGGMAEKLASFLNGARYIFQKILKNMGCL